MRLVVFVHGMLEHVLLIVAQEDHIQVVVVLDVLDPVCVYTLIFFFEIELFFYI